MTYNNSVLSKITHKIVKTEIEEVDLYQLGIFNESAYTLVAFKEGKYYPPHIHSKSTAKIHIIFGSGIIILNGKEKLYTKGDVFLIEKNISHCFRVKEETLFLAIETPPIINTETEEIDIEYAESKVNGGRIK